MLSLCFPLLHLKLKLLAVAGISSILYVLKKRGGGGDSVDYLNLFCFYAGLDRDLSFCGFRCIKHGL